MVCSLKMDRPLATERQKMARLRSGSFRQVPAIAAVPDERKATVHGFRGLAGTVLNESGLFEPDWIEHQLAHTPRGVVRLIIQRNI